MAEILKTLPQYLFYSLIVRPVLFLIVGLRVKNLDRLPTQGPLVLIANHASHLDTMILVCLFPLRMLSQIRPVAAADYFFKTPGMKWFSTYILRAIPVYRNKVSKNHHPLEEVFSALQENKIIIYFPEGTRSLTGKIGPIRNGIVAISEKFPKVPILPVFLQGPERVWPKGSFLFLPLNCSATIGHPLFWNQSAPLLKKKIQLQLQQPIFNFGRNYYLWKNVLPQNTNLQPMTEHSYSTENGNPSDPNKNEEHSSFCIEDMNIQDDFKLF